MIFVYEKLNIFLGFIFIYLPIRIKLLYMKTTSHFLIFSLDFDTCPDLTRKMINKKKILENI